MEAKLQISSQNNGSEISFDFPNGTDCLKQHGFGFFLYDWEDGEVTITEEAKRVLLEKCRPRNGDVFPLELFQGKRIGLLANLFDIDTISRNEGSEDWIRELPILKSPNVPQPTEKD